MTLRIRMHSHMQPNLKGTLVLTIKCRLSKIY